MVTAQHAIAGNRTAIPGFAAEASAKLAAPYRHPSTSVIVHTLHGGQTSTYTLGPKHASAAPPEDLLFEIGSITKVFTALLLACLAQDGRIDPDQQIGSICPEFAGAPEWITPRRLATHTAGLPRLHVPIWTTLIAGVSEDPYADFSRDDLIAWVGGWRPSKPPAPTGHTYSNLGAGLLGEILAMSQGRTYEDLLREQIIAPLGLVDTAIALTDEQQERFAAPHSASGKPVPPWTFRAMAGAGALRSSAGDLARFAGRIIAAITEPAGPLDQAIGRSTEPVVGLGPRGAKLPIAQCLGWVSMTLNPGGPRMLFHDGGTAGSASALYVCPEKQAAIVVLANRGAVAGVWSSLKLIRSNPHREANEFFAAL